MALDHGMALVGQYRGSVCRRDGEIAHANRAAGTDLDAQAAVVVASNVIADVDETDRRRVGDAAEGIEGDGVRGRAAVGDLGGDNDVLAADAAGIGLDDQRVVGVGDAA